MKYKQELSYATKIWLFSVFVSPIIILFFAASSTKVGNVEEVLGFLGVFILYGGIFSIPSWLLFMLGVIFSNKISFPTHPKVKIQIIATVLCVLPFLLLFGGLYNNVAMMYGIPYLVTLSIGIWYFELQPRGTNTPMTIDHLIE